MERDNGKSLLLPYPKMFKEAVFRNVLEKAVVRKKTKVFLKEKERCIYETKEKMHEMCISDRSMCFSSGSILICIFLFVNGIPAIGKDRTAEILFGTDVETVKQYIWNPSDDRRKYLCNCRSNSDGCAIAILHPYLWQVIVRKGL